MPYSVYSVLINEIKRGAPQSEESIDIDCVEYRAHHTLNFVSCSSFIWLE